MHRAIVRVMAVAGIALLALSSCLPWFEVPADFEVTPAGAVQCVTARPVAARLYGLACLAAAAMFVRGRVTRGPHLDSTAVTAVRLLVSLLFFPYFVMTWDPAVAARASWLHLQHYDLVWPGGDLSLDQGYAALSWKDRIYVSDPPQQVYVAKIPTWASGALQLGQLPVLAEVFGYSNRFCQFIRPGWFLAQAGALGVLLSACLAGGVLQPHRVLVALRAGLLAGVAGLILGAIPLVAAAWELNHAREATVRGHYEVAARHLRRAALVLPVIGEDTYYVMQLGLLHWRLDRLESSHARNFRANLLERQGRYAQALEEYRGLLARIPRDTAVHREACRAVLRAGINALNAGRTDRAIELLETVLAHEPCNLKANFALQLAYLRTSRRQDLERLVERIQAIYARFQFPTKDLVLSFSEENLLFAAFQAGDFDASVVHAYKAKHPEDRRVLPSRAPTRINN